VHLTGGRSATCALTITSSDSVTSQARTTAHTGIEIREREAAMLARAGMAAHGPQFDASTGSVELAVVDRLVIPSTITGR
jgi:hypothetical protein